MAMKVTAVRPWNIKPGDYILVWDFGNQVARKVDYVEKTPRYFGAGNMYRIGFDSAIARTGGLLKGDSVLRFPDDRVEIIRAKDWK